jgi:hypothetical protein
MDMPQLSNKNAPKQFTGHFEEVDEFLMRYEQCCHDCNLTDERLKTYTIRRYCNRKVRGVLEGLAESYGASWPKFKKAFEEYFDAARARRKYRETDLAIFVEDSRLNRMQNLTQFKKYMREFATIGGWLHQKGKISSKQRCKYFWAGLHKKFRDAAERRILSVDPDWDIATPFKVEMVTEAAKYLLDPERFDADVLEDEGDERGRWVEDDRRTARPREGRGILTRRQETKRVTYEEDEPLTTWESEDEEFWSRKSSANESTERASTRRSAAKKEPRYSEDEDASPVVKKRLRRARSPLPKEEAREQLKELDREEEKAAREDDLAVVLKKMERLSVDDPVYITLYARAVSLQPLIQPVLRVPTQASAPPMPRPVAPRRTPGVYTAQMSSAPMQTGMSGTYPNNLPLGPRRSMSAGPPLAQGCFGCGDPAHQMRDCGPVNNWVSKQVVRRDELGRLVFTNGSRIMRRDGENWSKAIERIVGQRGDSGVHMIRWISEEADDEASEASASSGADEELSNSGTSAQVLWGELEPYETDASSDASEDVWGEQIERTPLVMVASQAERQNGRAREARAKAVAVPKRPIKVAEKYAGVRTGPPRDFASARKKAAAPAAAREDPKPSERTSDKAPSQLAPLTPVDVHGNAPGRSARNDSDWVMEDRREGRVTLPKLDVKRNKKSENANTHVEDEAARIVDRFLEVQIPMTLGNSLLVSKAVKQQFGRKLKELTTNAVAQTDAEQFAEVHGVTASKMGPRLKEDLIAVTLKHGPNPVCAIVDTGAQINIVRKDVWKKYFRDVPIDKSMKGWIGDANGGRGNLLGLLGNVTLDVGNVRTETHLYVAKHVPFGLLLGRPWQRANRVSIVEDGRETSVVFRVPNSERPGKWRKIAMPAELIQESHDAYGVLMTTWVNPGREDQESIEESEVAETEEETPSVNDEGMAAQPLDASRLDSTVPLTQTLLGDSASSGTYHSGSHAHDYASEEEYSLEHAQEPLDYEDPTEYPEQQLAARSPNSSSGSLSSLALPNANLVDSTSDSARAAAALRRESPDFRSEVGDEELLLRADHVRSGAKTWDENGCVILTFKCDQASLTLGRELQYKCGIESRREGQCTVSFTSTSFASCPPRSLLAPSPSPPASQPASIPPTTSVYSSSLHLPPRLDRSPPPPSVRPPSVSPRPPSMSRFQDKKVTRTTSAYPPTIDSTRTNATPQNEGRKRTREDASPDESGRYTSQDGRSSSKRKFVSNGSLGSTRPVSASARTSRAPNYEVEPAAQPSARYPPVVQGIADSSRPGIGQSVETGTRNLSREARSHAPPTAITVPSRSPTPPPRVPLPPQPRRPEPMVASGCSNLGDYDSDPRNYSYKVKTPVPAQKTSATTNIDTRTAIVPVSYPPKEGAPPPITSKRPYVSYRVEKDANADTAVLFVGAHVDLAHFVKTAQKAARALNEERDSTYELEDGELVEGSFIDGPRLHARGNLQGHALCLNFLAKLLAGVISHVDPHRLPTIPEITDSNQLSKWLICSHYSDWAHLWIALVRSPLADVYFHVPSNFLFAQFADVFSVDPLAEPFVPGEPYKIKSRDFEKEQPQTRRMFEEYENDYGPEMYDADGKLKPLQKMDSSSEDDADGEYDELISDEDEPVEPLLFKKDDQPLRLYEQPAARAQTPVDPYEYLREQDKIVSAYNRKSSEPCFYSMRRFAALNTLILYIGGEVDIDELLAEARRTAFKNALQPSVGRSTQEPKDVRGYLARIGSTGAEEDVTQRQSEGEPRHHATVLTFLTNVLEGVSEHEELRAAPTSAEDRVSLGEWRVIGPDHDWANIRIFRVRYPSRDIDLRIPYMFAFRHFLSVIIDPFDPPRHLKSGRAAAFWSEYILNAGQGLPVITNPEDGSAGEHIVQCWSVRSTEPDAGVTLSWVDNEGQVHNTVEDPAFPLGLEELRRRAHAKTTLESFVSAYRNRESEPAADVACVAPADTLQYPEGASIVELTDEDILMDTEIDVNEKTTLNGNDAAYDDYLDEQGNRFQQPFRPFRPESPVYRPTTPCLSEPALPSTPQEALHPPQGALRSAVSSPGHSTGSTDAVSVPAELASAAEDEGWEITSNTKTVVDDADELAGTPSSNVANCGCSCALPHHVGFCAAPSLVSDSGSSMDGVETGPLPLEPVTPPPYNWGGVERHDLSVLIEKMDSFKITLESIGARADAQGRDLELAVERCMHDTRTEVRDLGRDTSHQLDATSHHLGDVVRDVQKTLGQPLKHVQNMVTSATHDAAVTVKTLERLEDRITPRLENLERYIINAYGMFTFMILFLGLPSGSWAGAAMQGMYSTYPAYPPLPTPQGTLSLTQPSPHPTLPATTGSYSPALSATQYPLLATPGSQTLADGSWYLPATTPTLTCPASVPSQLWPYAAGVSATGAAAVAAAATDSLSWRAYAQPPTY